MKTKSFVFSNSHITFIKGVDSLGQGVGDYNGCKIVVPKTVLGDEIECEIVGKKKNTYFGKLKKVLRPSNIRITPECTHYDVCNGCQYQHISFPDEQKIKEESLKNTLSYLPLAPMNVFSISTSQRFFYRNRIQLHYKLLPNPIIGMKYSYYENFNNDQIIPIPECILPNKTLSNFYKNFIKNWTKIIPLNPPPIGHVELYEIEGSVHLSWNESYSHLGFSQVNTEANELLKKIIQSILGFSTSTRGILELFCGNGNLLKNLPECFCLIGFDHQGALPSPHSFIKMDLYSKNVSDMISRSLQNFPYPILDLVLDPPRTGFKDLSSIVELLPSLERLIYVSCWPSTMVRDLNQIYKIRPWIKIQSWCINMFPATKHYESVVFIDWSK